MADRLATPPSFLMPLVLSVAPHPDDELLGAPATLMALRDAGWRVVNLACGLGRREDAVRRRAELTEACGLAGFELTIPEQLPPIGRDDDLVTAQRVLAQLIGGAVRQTGAELLVGPSPHDGHHGHEVVGRAIRDAVQGAGTSIGVMLWGLWGDLPLANLLHPFGAARLEEIERALGAHAGELERNRYDQLVEARARAAAILGPERIFGFGARGIAEPYAELLTALAWSPEYGWRLARPALFDATRPVPEPGGTEIGWWLEAPSVRSRLLGR